MDNDDENIPPLVRANAIVENVEYLNQRPLNEARLFENVEREEATGHNLDAPPRGVDLRNQVQENPDGSEEAETGKVAGSRRKSRRRKSRRRKSRRRKSRSRRHRH